MNKSKIGVVFVIILIIAVLGTMSCLSAGLFKSDSEIKVLSKDTLNQDEKFIVQLKSKEGNLTNKTVHFKLIDKNGNVKNYTADTNKNGKAKLKLKDIKAGTYTVNISFDGDDKYNGANASQKLKVKKVAVEKSNETQQTASQESYSDNSQSSESNDIVSSREVYDNEFAGQNVKENKYENGDVEHYFEDGSYDYYDSSAHEVRYVNKDGSSGSMYVGN